MKPAIRIAILLALPAAVTISGRPAAAQDRSATTRATTAVYRPADSPVAVTPVQRYRPYRRFYRPYYRPYVYRPYVYPVYPYWPYPAYGYGYGVSVRSPYYYGYRYPGARARGYYPRPRIYAPYGF